MKLVIPERDRIEVSVDDNGMVRIEQSDSAGNDPLVIVVHPNDMAQLMAMLEKAQAHATEIVRNRDNT